MGEQTMGALALRHGVSRRSFEADLTGEQYAAIQSLIQARGLREEDFVRMALLAAIKAKHHYDLKDALRIGRHYGERLEVVIRAAPDYVRWCVNNIEGFSLTQEAHDLLLEMEAAA